MGKKLFFWEWDNKILVLPPRQSDRQADRSYAVVCIATSPAGSRKRDKHFISIFFLPACMHACMHVDRYTLNICRPRINSRLVLTRGKSRIPSILTPRDRCRRRTYMRRHVVLYMLCVCVCVGLFFSLGSVPSWILGWSQLHLLTALYFIINLS